MYDQEVLARIAGVVDKLSKAGAGEETRVLMTALTVMLVGLGKAMDLTREEFVAEVIRGWDTCPHPEVILKGPAS